MDSRRIGAVAICPPPTAHCLRATKLRASRLAASTMYHNYNNSYWSEHLCVRRPVAAGHRGQWAAAALGRESLALGIGIPPEEWRLALARAPPLVRLSATGERHRRGGNFLASVCRGSSRCTCQRAQRRRAASLHCCEPLAASRDSRAHSTTRSQLQHYNGPLAARVYKSSALA